MAANVKTEVNESEKYIADQNEWRSCTVKERYGFIEEKIDYGGKHECCC